MKLLSIAIPSYNMEEYLSRSLNSLVVPTILNKLEIIIVNDGSSDRTLDIAQSYRDKYPNSVVVIDKPNGHYGSCINAALKIATGKYFRILDADDWFDSKSLEIIVNQIQERYEDVLFTKFTRQYLYLNRAVDNSSDGIIWNKTLSLDNYVLPKVCFAMHSLTYRTDFLKSIYYKQTEGVCYTDTEYVYFPLIQAKTIYCFNLSLYQYFIGRDDQTMSKKSMAKNFTHFLTVLQSLNNFESEEHNYNASYTIMHNHYFKVLFNYLFVIQVLYDKWNVERNSQLHDIFVSITKNNIDLKKSVLNQKIRLLKLYKYWYEDSLSFKLYLFIKSLVTF